MTQIELNKIYNIDCLEFMKTLPDNYVDLIITDPPYGMDFQSNYRKDKYDKIIGDNSFGFNLWFKEFKRITKKGIYIFCRWDNFSDINFKLNKPTSILCWVKNNWSMGDLKHEHGRQWEAIIFYALKEHEFIKRIPDIIKSKRTENKLHPTEKPVDLIRKIIISSNKGDLVFDPFIGSGSTAVACKQLNRNFIGCELSAEYCAIANKRLSQSNLNEWSE